jgi:hypothetical protein
MLDKIKCDNLLYAFLCSYYVHMTISVRMCARACEYIMTLTDSTNKPYVLFNMTAYISFCPYEQA